MKIILLVTFLGASLLSTSQVCFSGLIENYNGKAQQVIEVFKPVNGVAQFWYTNKEEEISINSDGSFNKKINPTSPGTYILNMPDEKKISVHITAATDSVFLTFKKEKETFLLTHIAGSNGAGNLFLNEEKKNIDRQLTPIFAGSFNTAAFWDSIGRIEKTSKQKVATLLQQKAVNDTLGTLLLNAVETEILHELYTYTQNLLFTKSAEKDKAKQIIDSAYKRYYPLRTAYLKADRTALTNAYKYVRSINEMHIPTSDPRISKPDSNWAALDVGYEIASQLPEPYREAQLADYILINYFHLGNADAKKAMLLFSKQYPTSAYASVFLQAFVVNDNQPDENSIHAVNTQINTDNPSIHFVSGTSGLQELIKKEFKGKFVLIDCWATWCKYCIAEFPFYKGYNAFMQENGIELLFVSFDKYPTDKDWRPMVVSRKIEGQHTIVNSKLESDILSVASIKKGQPLPLPRYLLIGPNGKVLSNDFDRPSSPQFLDHLKKYVRMFNTNKPVIYGSH